MLNGSSGLGNAGRSGKENRGNGEVSGTRGSVALVDRATKLRQTCDPTTWTWKALTEAESGLLSGKIEGAKAIQALVRQFDKAYGELFNCPFVQEQRRSTFSTYYVMAVFFSPSGRAPLTGMASEQYSHFLLKAPGDDLYLVKPRSKGETGSLTANAEISTSIEPGGLTFHYLVSWINAVLKVKLDAEHGDLEQKIQNELHRSAPFKIFAKRVINIVNLMKYSGSEERVSKPLSKHKYAKAFLEAACKLEPGTDVVRENVGARERSEIEKQKSQIGGACFSSADVRGRRRSLPNQREFKHVKERIAAGNEFCGLAERLSATDVRRKVVEASKQEARNKAGQQRFKQLAQALGEDYKSTLMKREDNERRRRVAGKDELRKLSSGLRKALVRKNAALVKKELNLADQRQRQNFQRFALGLNQVQIGRNQAREFELELLRLDEERKVINWNDSENQGGNKPQRRQSVSDLRRKQEGERGRGRRYSMFELGAVERVIPPQGKPSDLKAVNDKLLKLSRVNSSPKALSQASPETPDSTTQNYAVQFNCLGLMETDNWEEVRPTPKKRPFGLPSPVLGFNIEAEDR